MRSRKPRAQRRDDNLELPVSAVYVEFDSGDKGCILRREKRHSRRHFLGLSEPLHRNSLQYALGEFIHPFLR